MRKDNVFVHTFYSFDLSPATNSLGNVSSLFYLQFYVVYVVCGGIELAFIGNEMHRWIHHQRQYFWDNRRMHIAQMHNFICSSVVIERRTNPQILTHTHHPTSKSYRMLVVYDCLTSQNEWRSRTNERICYKLLQKMNRIKLKLMCFCVTNPNRWYL